MKMVKICLFGLLIFMIGCAGSTNFTSAKVYYYKNKDYAKAESFAKLAIQDEPQNWEAYLILALALAQQEKYAEAADAFKKAKELAPENKKKIVSDNQRSFFVTNYNKGISANTMMDYQKAAEFFEKAVAVDPENPKGYINLGVAYSKLKQHDKSLEAFKKAIEVDSTSVEAVEAWRNLGITYQANGDYENAAKAFAKVAELAPDDYDGHFSLGDMYFQMGDRQEALESYLKAAEIKGDDAALQYQIGACYFTLKKYKEAGQAFQMAAALSRDKDPDLYKDALFNLGVSYLKMQDYDAAITTLKRVLAIEETSEVHEMLGAAYGKKGMKEEAIKEFERAKELSGK